MQLMTITSFMPRFEAQTVLVWRDAASIIKSVRCWEIILSYSRDSCVPWLETYPSESAQRATPSATTPAKRRVSARSTVSPRLFRVWRLPGMGLIVAFIY